MSERNKHKKSLHPSSSNDYRKQQQTQTLSLASLLTRHFVPFRSRRLLLHLTLPTFVLLLLYFYFLRSFSSSSSSSYSTSSVATSPPPKIYVYNLPRKFTYGVVESYLLARNPSKTAISDSDLKYPGHQHSAEWWLFDDINRPNRGGSPVVRVDDPEKADLFYVPFFSSLSLVVNPIRPAAGTEGVTSYSDGAMQEEMMEWLEGQKYWKRNGGRDHVFICQDPNALIKVMDRIKGSVLLVSDFGRLRGDQSSLVKDVILPYSHRINTFKGEVGVANRKSLLFFMGNRYRKEGGKIRDMLFQILEGEDDVVIKHGAQSRESRRAATHGMHSSKFCLHPAGDTPSACRLFDAIVSLCIPVVVSDDIELPFEDVVDYRKIAIFVDAQRAVTRGYLLKLLRGVTTETILQYQNEIKAVKHNFEYDVPNGAVNEIWRQVSLKVPLIKLMNNRDKRLVERKTDGLDCSCICSRQNGTVHFST